MGKQERKPFAANRPLAELHEVATRLYRRQLKRMIQALDDYVEREVGLEVVKASRAVRPFLTKTQLRELVRIIKRYHTAIAIQFAGPSVETRAEVLRLVKMGLLPEGVEGLLDDAFTFGRLLAAVQAARTKTPLTQPRIDKMTLETMQAKLKAEPVPLTPVEERAVVAAREHAAVYIRGLGNKVSTAFVTMAIEADKDLQRRYAKMITETVEEGIARRKAWRKIKSDLGHRSGDWARDFDRIAATEKQRAMQEGMTTHLRAKEGPSALVAKIPTPAACKHCIRLHLTAGPGSTPRIFKLSDLEANGSNIDVKADAWLPVVGPVHPWCECALIHVPDGWGFDESNNLVPTRAHKAMLAHDLMKALDFGDAVPKRGVVVRVGDPESRAIIEEVISRTPPALFTSQTGVTLITTDHPSPQSHLKPGDYAYWTGNEIRLLASAPKDKLRTIMEHELAHGLAVGLIHKFGSVDRVRKWMARLYKVSQSEGFVSQYAQKNEVENAAEVTRLYLYGRAKMMAHAPRQFTFCHKSYKDILRADKRAEQAGLTREAIIDALTAAELVERFKQEGARLGMHVRDIQSTLVLTREAAEDPSRINAARIALLSGQHGEERAGPIALLTWMERQEELPEGISYWIAPLLSMDVWDSRKREHEGVNHNDEWYTSGPYHSHVKATARSLKAFSPTAFLDLHEDQDIADGQPAVYALKGSSLPGALGARLRPVKVRAKHDGSAESFARRAGARAATVETAQTEPLRDRVAFHVKAIEAALQA